MQYMIPKPTRSWCISNTSVSYFQTVDFCPF